MPVSSQDRLRKAKTPRTGSSRARTRAALIRRFPSRVLRAEHWRIWRDDRAATTHRAVDNDDIVIATLVAVYAPTLSWLWDRWTLSVWQHAHGVLIPPVVAYFVYLELQGVRHLPPASSPWGFAILVPALLLHVLDTGMHTQLLSAVSLILALPGLSLLFIGTARTKAILFPLAFAAFALPIPLALTEDVHLALRHVGLRVQRQFFDVRNACTCTRNDPSAAGDQSDRR